MPPKNKKAKNKKTKGKEKAAPQARLGHGNELLRLGELVVTISQANDCTRSGWSLFANVS